MNHQNSLLSLTALTCLISCMVCISAKDRYVWTCGASNEDSYTVFNDVDITVNIKTSSECRLMLNASLYLGTIALSVRLSGSRLSEICHQNMSSLVYVLKPLSNEEFLALLMCGNELAPWTVQTLPFTLLFQKSLAMNQSMTFDISLTIRQSRENLHMQTQDVDPNPTILYSPLYPLIYYPDTHFEGTLRVRRGMAVFFETRYMDMMGEFQYCPDRIVVSGGNNLDYEDLCGNYQVSTVFVPRSYTKGLKLHFSADNSYTGKGFELTYRSIKDGPKYNCGFNVTTTFLVKESTYITFQMEVFPPERTSCEVTFSGLSPGESLVLTNVTSGYIWNKLCEFYQVDIFVGIELPKNPCGHSSVGLIRAMPDQEIKIVISVQWENYYASYGDNERVEVGFVVETGQLDKLPSGMNAHTSPSYLWIPRKKDFGSHLFKFEIRSANSSCVEFSHLSKRMTRKKSSLASSMLLYSGNLDTEKPFEMTRDCKGDKRTETVIPSGGHRNTLAYINWKSSSGQFWFTFSQTDSEPCPALATAIEGHEESMTLEMIGFKASGHMNCMFVLSPYMGVSKPATKFRGKLDTRFGADFYVKEDLYTTHVLANFQQESDNHWYTSSNILYIYLKSRDFFKDDIFQFEFKSKYKQGDTIQWNPACPVPQTIVLKETSKYSSLDYPNYLPSNLTCRWNFTRPSSYNPAQYLHVSFDNIILHCTSSTKLFIRGDGYSSDSVCDVDSYFRVFPGDVVVEVQGGMDDVISRLRFEVFLRELDYHQVCNSSHNIEGMNTGIDVTGTLSYGHYLVPLHCWIHLYTEDYRERLAIRLNSLMMQGHHYSIYQCDQNSLTIYDGDTQKDRKLIETCFSNGRSIISSANHILIQILVQHAPETPVNFNMSVKRSYESCRGHVNMLTAKAEERTLTSPGYPKLYPPNCVCQWKLESEDGYNIEIEITYLDIERSSSCIYDYLEIFDGPKKYSHSLGQFCGEWTTSKKFRSSYGTFFLLFKTDELSNNKGFTLDYRTRKYPSPDFTNGPVTSDKDDSESSGNSTGDDSESSGNSTGVIIGAILAVILGVFGIGFVCILLVHKKRVRDNRRRRRGRPELQLNSTSGESSVFVINPLIVNNAAPPPPYPGITNLGFVGEEPPPSYHDALRQLTTTTLSTPTASTERGRQPPPPYSVSTPRGHEAVINEENEVVYDNTQTGGDDNGLNCPIYETLQSPRRQPMDSVGVEFTTSNQPPQPSEEPSSHHDSLPRGEEGDDTTSYSVPEQDMTGNESEYNLPEDSDVTYSNNRSCDSLGGEPRAPNSPTGSGNCTVGFEPDNGNEYSLAQELPGYDRNGVGDGLAPRTNTYDSSQDGESRNPGRKTNSSHVGNGRVREATSRNVPRNGEENGRRLPGNQPRNQSNTDPSRSQGRIRLGPM